ncbi:ABC transporter ATP-binding protein [Salinicoccus halodurans]|uniref:ABC-type glutathione transport system ATPase component, contains duplicated ATPase domain n=1 Tax=Salinicoccus halodurans TaxID=407035 RepID=A0AA94KX04_9STAP|nr:ATP-binding cassette domain-containing protein [Salinicoccus halodurans]SFK88164.1 ABC-type glutathione transport system ATPase component, contains duplicated ATPase domain [Salinicoccus halodurans]
MVEDKNIGHSGETPLLEVKDFSLIFRHYGKGLRERDLEVVRNFNLTIHEGEIVAVLGASGSGKSLLANAILGILPDNAVTSGTLNYKGAALTEKKQALLRGKEISLIPQSVNALDPLMKTGKQVRTMIARRNKKRVQQDIFKKVGLPDSAGDRYPFELSGGMARRVLISTSMAGNANLVIADEPTPGLDPAVLQETVGQMRRLADAGKGMMFITHDIEIALQIADKIAVFYEGETIEIAQAGDFSGKGERLRHPYTRALWRALPKNDFISLQPSAYSNSRKSGKPSLEIKGISYHYPNSSWLFKDLDLTVQPGEIVGVYGHSGSGKSTMAQVIAGYRTTLGGTVEIAGKTIPKKGRHPVQMVWQHPEKAINPRWRIKQTLQEAGEIDQKLLKTLGIRQDWLERWPSELSGGELQRFCLARAMTGDTEYLVADEITTMLDAVTQSQIWHSLIELADERGVGILAISHDYHLLERVCDRIIHFDDLK